jgi:hypothetical protein
VQCATQLASSPILLGTDTIGDAVESIGIPLGVAMECIRQTMLQATAAIATEQGTRTDLYQRDADGIAETDTRHDLAA